MVDPCRGTGAALTLARCVVVIAARLVPVAQRGEWAREWSGELWHLHRSLEAEGRPSAWDRAAFVVRSTGSVVDALQFRLGDAQSWGETFRAVATRWAQHTPSVAIALLFLSAGIAADALLIASGHIMVAVPRSAWTSLTSETQLQILGTAIVCGVLLIGASAAAAAQLLGSSGPRRCGDRSAWVAETLLIAGITGWVGRWFAAFGMRSAIASPYAGEWLASVDLGGAVTSGWAVSWVCGLALLGVLRMPRGPRMPPPSAP